jgi:acyl-CoA reductase-like NAD-dependent aldehyde dehydrogenase
MITPYNYPLIVLSERLPFALAAGCSVVVKPSEFTPASTVLLSEIANDAGLPNRAFQVAVGGSDLGAALTSNPLFRLVSFTGSTKTAATVASLIDHRRVRTSFELGGKNSFIVFPDADIEAAVESAAYATTVNGGQACIAPSRIIIHSEIAEEFQHRLGQAYAQIVSENLKEFGVPIQQPPTEQFAARARKLLKTIESAGWSLNDDWTSSTSTAQLADWIRPHIFHVEHVDHPLFSEEFFVPYVTISCFSDMDQAVELANIGELGLAAYFWSSSRETFNELHARVRAGRQWWNCDMRSFSPKLPIGGLELSGIGRELGMAALDYYRLPVAATIQSL